MTRLKSIQIKSLNINLQKEFTATKLIEKVNNHTSSNTMQDLIDSEIERLKQESRLKSAIIYKELRTSLLEFNKHLDTRGAFRKIKKKLFIISKLIIFNYLTND